MNREKISRTVNEILTKRRQYLERDEKENHDSCLALKNKLEYLIRTPESRTMKIKSIGKYTEIFRNRRSFYYTDCDEMKLFIGKHNDSDISFECRNYFVGAVRTVVVNDNKLRYVLYDGYGTGSWEWPFFVA